MHPPTTLPFADSYTAAPLALAATASWQRVVELAAVPSSSKRLMDLGLTPGCRVYVASVSGSGVVLHLTGNLRLAVDAALAQMVWVEPVSA